MDDELDPTPLPISSLVGDTVVRVRGEATLLEVADVLHDGEIGVVAVGEDDLPDGVVSERDLVRALAERRDPATTTAADIAHSPVRYVDPRATIDEVATEMMTSWVRHAFVAEGGTLVGVVSARDLLGVMAATRAEPEVP
jgi:CBS domain-containing protein